MGEETKQTNLIICILKNKPWNNSLFACIFSDHFFLETLSLPSLQHHLSAAVLNVVVFPAPFGPKRPKHSFFDIPRVRWSTATSFPYRLYKSNRIKGSEMFNKTAGQRGRKDSLFLIVNVAVFFAITWGYSAVRVNGRCLLDLLTFLTNVL